MRQFRRDIPDEAGEYDCQRDGMLGIGAGARSYTAGLHYYAGMKVAHIDKRDVEQESSERVCHGHHTTRRPPVV